jgi:high-affinity Fe2+/Pb2+ permease
MFKGVKGGKLLSFQRIIIISSIFLLFTSAGMTMYASHEIQEEGAFGTWEPSSERSWLNKSVWDISTCCNDKTGFFAIMRSVIGYQDKPTPLEIFAYLIYWTLIVISLYIIKKHTKKDKHVVENDSEQEPPEHENDIDNII